MAVLQLEDGLRSLETRTRLAQISIGAYILFKLGAILGEAALGLDPGLALSPSGRTIGVAILAALVAYVISVIFVGMWIYRAHANLDSAGLAGLEFTPGWSVGWFFVPFANLVKPFQAMRELWNASHMSGDRFSKDAPGLLTVWWALFITGNVLSNVSSRIMDMPGAGNIGMLLGALGGTLALGCAVALWAIVQNVVAAQRNMMAIGEAFA